MPLNFDTLPITEAASDADHFVCEFPGGSNTNETGAGGGLSGADLVFTRFGTVGAASSGWRAVSTSSGFSITDTWVDTFVRNAAGCAMLWHMKDVGGNGNIIYVYGVSPSILGIYTTVGTSNSINFYGATKFGIGMSPNCASRGDLWPASGEFWILCSVDYTNDLAFVGVAAGTAQPTKLTDFDAYAVSVTPQAPLASAITLMTGQKNIIGNVVVTPVNPTFSVKSVTAKKGASVTLA